MKANSSSDPSTLHVYNTLHRFTASINHLHVKRDRDSYPSGEYSRLNTAPCVCVLKLTDSAAGFMELYKLVIVRKLSLAGSTNTPRLIVLLCNQENRLFPLPLSEPEPPPLPVCGAAACWRRVSRFFGTGELAPNSGCPSLLACGEGSRPRGTSSSRSESPFSGSLWETLPLLTGLSGDSSASSPSLWRSELIVAASVCVSGRGVWARRRKAGRLRSPTVHVTVSSANPLRCGGRRF